MGHEEAIEAICGCSRTVTVLSYQEAIEGYLKLRGMQPAQQEFDAAGDADLSILETHGALSLRLAASLPEPARQAWHHLTSMYSHRGDGIPTQYLYPQEVRDAAKELVKAALRTDRAAVVEECARVAENLEPPRDWTTDAWGGAAAFRKTIAQAIRALAGGTDD